MLSPGYLVGRQTTVALLLKLFGIMGLSRAAYAAEKYYLR